jgi:hypothetical protein
MQFFFPDLDNDIFSCRSENIGLTNSSPSDGKGESFMRFMKILKICVSLGSSIVLPSRVHGKEIP